MKNEVLNSCQDLIKHGNIAASLEALAEYCKQSASEHHDAILLLSAQWRQHQKERTLGISDNITTSNRITQAALQIIRELEKSEAGHQGVRLGRFSPRILGWTLSLLVFAVAVWVFSQKQGNNNVTHGAQSPIIENGANIEIQFHNNSDTNEIRPSE
jgi:hypothetical protein